jgi:uncharacterized iron-regulated membrane protein
VAVLRLVHRWIGLTLALVIAAVAISGGLLLLRDPYYRAVYPVMAAPITAAEHTSRALVLGRIEQTFTADGVQTIKFPRAGANAYHVYLRDGTEAFVDALSGHVIDRWHWSQRVPAFLFELHAHLFAEDIGSTVNGIVALGLVFMALTGLVLWWPARRRAFALRGMLPKRLSPGHVLRSHAASGAVAVLPVLVFAVTGAAIVFYEPTAALAGRLLDARPAEEPMARVAAREQPRRSWDELLPVIDATLADGETVFYYPPSGSNARLMFRKRLPGEWHPNGRSYVIIDPYTGAVAQAIDARSQGAGTRLMHAVYPVHAAKVGGVAMTALAAVAAMALVWLSVGGAWAYAGRAVIVRRRGVPRRVGSAGDLANQTD